MPIALLTDFGTRDYFVAAMKGRILSIDPAAVIVDITHEIEPQNIADAAFSLQACYRDFPERTVFVCVVDPGVGSDRRPIAVEAEGYIFVGPDNGLFSFVIRKASRVIELNNAKFFAPALSSTFHGRDIFAPVAAHFSAGVMPEDAGTPVEDPMVFDLPKPVFSDDGRIEGAVIHIDRFGNLVTNIPSGRLPEGFRITIGGTSIAKSRDCFSDGPGGELFAINGSAGFVEIAVFRGSAAKLTGIKAGDAVVVEKKKN